MSEVALSTRASRRRRRVALVLVPAALVLLAATGFTTYVLTREPTQLDSIACFETPDSEANVAVVSADGRDPVAVCGELWRQGAFGSAPEPDRLVACVLATGPVGVFPSAGPGTCDRLGLAELPAGYRDQAERFAGLRDALVADFAVGCIYEEEARARVRDELDRRGYRDWEIEVGPGSSGEGFSSERPCASLSFDGVTKSVVLVPSEPGGIVCYERPTLPSPFVARVADGRNPVAVCAELWAQGRLASAGRPRVACLLHGSVVGVFPAPPRRCRELGPAVEPLGP